MFEEQNREIKERWGSWEVYQAVSDAIKKCDSLYNKITSREINAFVDNLKEQGFAIVKIDDGYIPPRTSIDDLANAIADQVIERLKNERDDSGNYGA